MASYWLLGKGEDTSYEAGRLFGDLELEPLELPKARVPSIASTKTSVFWNDNDEHPLLSPPSRAPTYSEVPKEGEQTLRSSSIVSKQKRRKLQGWHFGVSVATWTTATVLLVNLLFTIVGVAKYHPQGGIGTALEGNCERVNRSATWIHLLINALSSVLLSASNYTMQCLYAPTRADIDRAHSRGTWLDVGVPGTRNLFSIARLRSSLWLLLALSSVPIHLLYNSAIFKSLDANSYDVLVATEDFLTRGSDANFTLIASAQTGVVSNENRDYLSVNEIQRIEFFQQVFAKDNIWQDGSRFETLSNKECITAYSNAYVSGRDHVIAITLDPTPDPNATALYYTVGATTSNDNSWICTPKPGVTYHPCNDGRNKVQPSDWTLVGKKIDHCIAHIQPSHCKLQFSVQILVAVIMCNVAKAVAMGLTLLKQKEATLVTIGDAVTSFLNDPDETTKNRCLMSKVDVGRGPLRWRKPGERVPYTSPRPIVYAAPLVRRWKSAVSKTRWTTTIGSCVLALTVACALLGVGASGAVNNGAPSAFGIGFGAVDPSSMISIGLPTTGASGLLVSVLLANLPQAILSVLYLMYNSLYTFMCLADEWSKFAGRRKPLRVTTPHGQQRSTYYLQLPYWYGIPLIIASATLHWLVSQSIFLARIDVYSDGQAVDDSEISQTGFSNAAILCTIVLGIAMLLVAVGMSFRKFRSEMPVVGSCSVAISAACHRPKADADAAYLPVKWGEVVIEDSDEVGHCCITSQEVRNLVPMRQYAGTQKSVTL
ncbi:hypothetical protein K431DRAFT_257778 [Polychaeton citri CBS 116435]|uniref:DUF6536 domain-containing protein n=1 Tax=Polychaeton citri CBS 116435 TaxID=1314669 RepID=A0A9P4UJF5_9PEZI|nr:hypothetical protein K431DRAFT_257778 [Polychaeton citri CBS 116435]